MACCRPKGIFFPFFFFLILFLAFQKMQIVAVLGATGDCIEGAAVQHQGIADV